MSANLKARAWVQVEADALRQNYTLIRDAVAPGARVMPMVKADAYGLGLEETVRCLDNFDPWGFGVATVQEGVSIRDIGVVRPILVCSPVPPDDLDRAVASDLQLSVSSLAALARIEEAARAASKIASIHIEVDTGMGRSGFDWRGAERWLPRVTARNDSVDWVGCYTHLHSADTDATSIELQQERFSEVLDRLGEAPEGLLIHALNSAGVLRARHFAASLVRPGIFLYGGEVGDGQPTPAPVVSVQARIAHIREVPPETTLGYGASYTSKGAERWATLSIGYGDGLPRSLGNRGCALIGGRRVPVIGRISMDVTVVDITGVEAVGEGDIATLIGIDGEEMITVDEVAGVAGTISYEILTGLTSRLPRVWSSQRG